MPTDEWSTETGLATDYSGTVLESWFGTDSRNDYNPDQLFLYWRIKLDDPLEFPGLHDGTNTERFSVGGNQETGNWETLDGGETAEFPGDSEKRFHANSNYGKIINRAVKDWKIKDMLAKRGSPTTARIWNGLRFHFGAEEWTYNEKKGERNMPDKYLGEQSGTTQAKAGKTVDLSGIPASHVEQLRAAAAESKSHGDFVSKVLGLPDDVRSDTVVNGLADESLYHSLRG